MTDLDDVAPHLPASRRPLLGDDWLARRDEWDAGLPPLTAGRQPAAVSPPEGGAAVRAGVLLMSGADDASHRTSQSDEGEPDCDYWHGLMHRREPDYGNALYWFRRVGQHPAMDGLPEDAAMIAAALGAEAEASGVLGPPWDGAAMVRLCERAERSPASELHLFARAVQWAEMRRLMRHCLRGG